MNLCEGQVPVMGKESVGENSGVVGRKGMISMICGDDLAQAENTRTYLS